MTTQGIDDKEPQSTEELVEELEKLICIKEEELKNAYEYIKQLKFNVALLKEQGESKSKCGIRFGKRDEQMY